MSETKKKKPVFKKKTASLEKEQEHVELVSSEEQTQLVFPFYVEDNYDPAGNGGD